MDIQLIYSLYKETRNRITSNSAEWMQFLNTVSHVPNYPFLDQILIHAQNPNCTACATIKQWNTLTQRFVPENSKAIALIRNKDGQSYLRYVFDISDTIETEYSTQPFDWNIPREWLPQILERLESYVPDLTSESNVEVFASNTVLTFVQENADRFADTDVKFEALLTRSVEYALFQRLNLPLEYFHPGEFSYIRSLERSKNLTLLGYSIQEVCKDIFHKIEREALHIQKNLAISEERDYNEDNKEFNVVNRESKGSDNHERNQVSGNRRVPGSQHHSREERTSSLGQVRPVEGKIPEGTQTRDLHGSAHGAETTGTPLRNRPDSQSTTRTDDESDDVRTRRQRKTKSTGSNEVGEDGQRNQGTSGGNVELADLQLSLFTSPEQQSSTIQKQRNTIKKQRKKAVEEPSPAFSYIQITLDDLEPQTFTSEPSKNVSEEPPERLEVQPATTSIAAVTETQTSSKTVDASVFTPLESPSITHTVPPVTTVSPDKPQERFIPSADDFISVGARERCKANLAAIRTLKEIDAADRKATPEEQHIMAKYVGWGGVQEAFDPRNEKWSTEYKELKSLLTEGEYKSARASVLTAHYTPAIIIESMYRAVQNMGISVNQILDPALGSGRYLDLMPSTFAGAKFHGIELDTITGNLAKHIYPDAKITVSGFEKSTLPANSFDLAIGNVPYGDFGVADPQYNKHKFVIHEYFFAKSLDLVRTGGIVAFITSRYSMDQKGTKFRRYMAERADLLGAMRLPDNAFKDAGTSVTADIWFLQKRDSPPEQEPSWINTNTLQDDLLINQYFLDHPDMVLGEMKTVSGPYGPELACKPKTNVSLDDLLFNAIQNLGIPDAKIPLEQMPPAVEQPILDVLDAAEYPEVSNYSFAEINSAVYYRENDYMHLYKGSEKACERIKSLIDLRSITRKLLQLQLDNAENFLIEEYQFQLGHAYDGFVSKHGLISDSANKRVFCDDDSYPLLCSLEVLDDNGNLERKADIFTKRTIAPAEVLTSVENANDALAICLNEKAKVDLEYMASLLSKEADVQKFFDTAEKIIEDLKGQIFKDPAAAPLDDFYNGWQTADEYLSGNVRKKLDQAKNAAEKDPSFTYNVHCLEQVQPKDLNASEIDVRLGAPWVGLEYYKQFMYELLAPPRWYRLGDKPDINLRYSSHTNEWNIQGKSIDRTNPKVNSVYGTEFRGAYSILEDSLNQRDSRVYKTVIEDGKEKRVLDAQKTAIVQQKQEAIAQAFQEWIWKDPERRIALCEKYNRELNSIRPREYNGDHIRFVGMNPEIFLLPHQRNAVARMLYGDNALLAHCVGAGKTFEIVAAAMESKRLGLCRKSIIVVPNHLTDQWGSEFLRLYPNANVLVTRKKDFEPLNRKKFCSRIATGNYDAVIIGHSQFERIPLSPEHQAQYIEEQIDQIMTELSMLEDEEGQYFTIKAMQKKQAQLEVKLSKLNETGRKDNTVFFEELGVDRLFVDEAHNYKNLFLYTKMRNVAGIGQTDAQKSNDMFMKCRYIDTITNHSGVVFATGTPISNSMVELYTMMRYLQYQMLEDHDFLHFDNWAATFGEKVTALEIAPEGTGFRTKTRFAKFFDLPELINLWKQSADIQTADMLDLPTPKALHETIVTKPSEFQKNALLSLADRADTVRNGSVDSSVDNMLKITSDGRKLALDQRLNNFLLPDDPDSKINACVNNIMSMWEKSAADKGAQLVFCDLSTPDATPREIVVENFSNVYDDIKGKLIQKGVPANEIAYIHHANTDAKKAELFAKVRTGSVRILLGSTAKMGAGTNVQDRLIALHHLDCPWRPSDIEQREGRILRQGNRYREVYIFKYVTENTFDAYNWSLIESKQKFIGQVMTSKSPVRSADDVDSTALSYAEVKSLATGDPRIKEKMDLDIQVSKLKLLKANHQHQQHILEDRILLYYPKQINLTKELIKNLTLDMNTLNAHPLEKDQFSIKVGNTVFDERSKAGTALLTLCQQSIPELVAEERINVGLYRGFQLDFYYDQSSAAFLDLKDHGTYKVEMSKDAVGIIMRIQNTTTSFEQTLITAKERLERLEKEVVSAKEDVKQPFLQENELKKKMDRLNTLNIELSSENREKQSEEKPRMSDQLYSARQKSNAMNQCTPQLSRENLIR